MPAGRPRRIVRPVKFETSMPEDVFARMQLALLEKGEMFPRKGSRSQLITSLVDQWLTLREEAIRT